MKTSPKLQKAVAEYQKGSVEAFNTIYEQSYKYLHTCVIHVVKNEDMAMDMLQETYLEISKSISQLKSTEDFLSWAAMIANRKCFAHLKKQKDVLVDGSGSGDGYSDAEDSVIDYFENIADSEEFIPETVLQDREKQRLMKEIIDGLNDMQRLCVIGFYYNEQKQEEIAEELGIPVNTVKSHLNRAKAKIKEAVVELDVKKGTRLYSFAPFMALLFREEVQACVLRPMSKGLASAVGISAGVGSSVLPGGLEAVKEFITENFGETLGEIFADTIGKAAVKIKALWAKFMASSIKAKAVVATTACAVTIGGAAVVMSPEEEVVEVMSADLDIIVTEEGISSELFDVDYTYSEEEQSYELYYYMKSDKEEGFIQIRTFNQRWLIPEEKELHSEGFVIDNIEFTKAIYNDRTYYFTPYIDPNGVECYYTIEFDDTISKKTRDLFIECMHEIEPLQNLEKYFIIQKEKVVSEVCGFELDLVKLQNEYDGVVYYAYHIYDGWDDKHILNSIVNNPNTNKYAGIALSMEEVHELHLQREGYKEKDDFINFSDLDWRCYIIDTSYGYYIEQQTLLDGTHWGVRFNGLEEGLDIQEWYEEKINNFDIGENPTTTIETENQLLICEPEEENVNNSERENISEQTQIEDEVEPDSTDLGSTQVTTVVASPIADATLVYSYETWGAAAKTYSVEEYSNGIWVSRAIEGWEGCAPEYWILRTDFSDCFLDEDGNGIDDRDPYNDCGYTDLNHNCMADGAPQLEMFCSEEEHTPFWTCDHGIINGAYICQRTECQEFREMMRNVRVYVDSTSD